jgi:hypothetical protein
MLKRVAVTAALLILGALFVIAGVIEISRQSAHPVRMVVAALLAAGAWLLILRMNVDALLRALNALRTVLPVATYLVTAFFVGSSHGTVAFDEIGAQIIVVLLLALALEARFFRLHRLREPTELGATLLIMLLLGVGEFYAVRAVATTQAKHADVVAGAIAAGFVAVAIAALTGAGDGSQSDQT